MLRIVIEGVEGFDHEKRVFIPAQPDVVLDLEHSLLALSKWESKFQKPFLSVGPKTTEEINGYLEAMVVTPDADLGVLSRRSKAVSDRIQEYIDSSQSATTFGTMPGRRGPSEPITSELIYYWMVSFNIPFECETWHINRLFSLIRICNIKNTPAKKIPRHEMAMRMREENARRKAQLGTRG